jgi:probable HAF family extracellular repeat protein
VTPVDPRSDLNMRHASSCYSCWRIAGLLVALIGLGTPANAQAPRYSVTDLGTLGGGTSKGYGINASGRVTGEAVTAGGVFHAFLYTPGSGMTDLGTLGGGSSTGYAINASGQVTGEAVTPGGALHAFLYAKRAMRDLNSMIDPAIAAQVTLFSGRGINDDGWIVANGVDSRTGVTHAYLLSKH